MKNLYEQMEVWLVAGSQHLYGPGPLQEVQRNTERIACEMNANGKLPFKLVAKLPVTTADEITALCRKVSATPECVGVIFWMHTFSPARMWIAGLKQLSKPFLHLHTQWQRDIPWSSLDMAYMNLHQSAHGDREFGYICTRLGKPRKIVVGYWQEDEVYNAVADWMRVAAAWSDHQRLIVARLGDNMRNVAVTEGDKTEAQIVFGYTVNGYGIGELAERVRAVDESAVHALCQEYDETYEMAPALRKWGECRAGLTEVARIEIGLRSFLTDIEAYAFTDTFEDLHGLRQLPGLPVQRLMVEGYGFGAEGDWKHAALVRALKVMGYGRGGGTSFMEDYTYHFDPADPQVLGAHMLEICPSIAETTPSCEIHPLEIGGKKNPVRLVFNAHAGEAMNATVVDLGDRFRMIVNPVDVRPPPATLPNLPVARALWKPRPDLKKSATEWIRSGGAHHTAFSYDVNIEQLEDFASLASIEFTQIG